MISKLAEAALTKLCSQDLFVFEFCHFLNFNPTFPGTTRCNLKFRTTSKEDCLNTWLKESNFPSEDRHVKAFRTSFPTLVSF